MTSDSKAEYDSIAENIRHYENLIFANLAAFMTVNGGLVGLVFAARSPLSPNMFWWVQWAGVWTAVVFGLNCWIYLFRCYELMDRQKELEKSHLHYEQYCRISPRSRRGYLLWAALFFSVAVFWRKAPLPHDMNGSEPTKAEVPLGKPILGEQP